MTEQNSLDNITHTPELMDKIYRNQRFIYNASRKFYLLGRDQLIASLTPPENGTVLELGCGTGRNLLCAAKRYKNVQFYGADISTEMLKTASTSVSNSKMQNRITLAKGDATNIDPQNTFGENKFDRVFISFTLSMVPEWEKVVMQAIKITKPGGEIHIADFGECKHFPALFRKSLYAWLNLFHVHPIENFPNKIARLVSSEKTSLNIKPLYAGYSLHAVIKIPA